MFVHKRSDVTNALGDSLWTFTFRSDSGILSVNLNYGRCYPINVKLIVNPRSHDMKATSKCDSREGTGDPFGGIKGDCYINNH